MIKDAILFAQTSLFDSISQMNPSANVPSVDSQTNVFVQIGEIVNYFLALVGLVMLFLIIYGGFNILTSQGNDEKIATSRKTIMYGIIGTVLIASAYALTSWIFGSSFFEGGGAESAGQTPNSGNVLQVIPQNGVRIE